MKSSLLFLSISLSVLPCFSQNVVRKDSITILFAHHKSEVTNIQALLSQLNKMDTSSIVLICLNGYTDSTSSVAMNKVLAAKRIESVKDLINKTNLRNIRLESKNSNETSGFRKNSDELNRRVDVLFYVKKEISKLVFQLNKPLNLNINFHPSSANFVPGSNENLERLLHVMKEDSTLQVKLHGHVCCRADFGLSVKRAEAVMIYLGKNGIDYDRIQAVGFSNSKPLFPDDSEEHSLLNRRVEAIFYKK